MVKHSFTHYYVQAQKDNEAPEIVAHTYDKKTKKYFHKFLDRKKHKHLQRLKRNQRQILNSELSNVQKLMMQEVGFSLSANVSGIAKSR